MQSNHKTSYIENRYLESSLKKNEGLKDRSRSNQYAASSV